MQPLATDAEIVARYGWNATAAQALNPEMRRWRAPEALVAFAEGRRWPGGPRVWLGAGEPICAPERLAEVAEAFAADARAAGASAAWFGASERFCAVWTGANLVLGAQPVWTPEAWPDILAGKASLRAQVNRARNKGVTRRDVGARARGGVWSPSGGRGSHAGACRRSTSSSRPTCCMRQRRAASSSPSATSGPSATS